LATDGLVAEREQGITIDVAHIYFLQLRKVISLQIPGHVEYNVTLQLQLRKFLILIDARKGVIEQTYRHFSSIIYCVKKEVLLQ
jgi:sulfate adenylyltransferase subunit 1